MDRHVEKMKRTQNVCVLGRHISAGATLGGQKAFVELRLWVASVGVPVSSNCFLMVDQLVGKLEHSFFQIICMEIGNF
jgi:hypothetical protein